MKLKYISARWKWALRTAGDRQKERLRPKTVGVANNNIHQERPENKDRHKVKAPNQQDRYRCEAMIVNHREWPSKGIKVDNNRDRKKDYPQIYTRLEGLSEELKT